VNDIADRVFGAYTRDSATLRWVPGGAVYQWASCFDGPKPDWYVDPISQTDIKAVVWGWGTVNVG
jgi:hypothetical protein